MSRKAKIIIRITILLLVILIITFFKAISVKAAVITGETHLAGFSKTLDAFYDRGGEFYSQEDLTVLSAVMELENGCNSDECLLWTGGVLINRARSCRWCPDTLLGCVLQGYQSKGPQQYATHTIVNLWEVVPSERTVRMAKQLLTFGIRIIPAMEGLDGKTYSFDSEYVYQSMSKTNGSDRGKVKIQTEYFAKD